jgi:hypothetical protein
MLNSVKKNIKSLLDGNTIELKGVVGNSYFHLVFEDIKSPIVITFSNAGEITTEKDINDSNYRPWGFDFVRKYGLNVLSFSSFKTEGWYQSTDFSTFITTLNKYLMLFPVRYGYGGSMGGFGVSVYSKILLIDELLLINPISSLAESLVPFETRFPQGKKQDWDGEFNDGAGSNCSGYIVYDPLFNLDSNHARRYKNMVHLKVPGVGHGMPMHLNKLGILKKLFEHFISGTLTVDWFKLQVRNRRNYEGYYEWLLSEENIHLTLMRKLIIKNKYLEFKLKSVNKNRFINGIDINNIRDAAIALEKVNDIALAKKMMLIAIKARPNGKLLKQKLELYEKIEKK